MTVELIVFSIAEIFCVFEGRTANGVPMLRAAIVWWNLAEKKKDAELKGGVAKIEELERKKRDNLNE